MTKILKYCIPQALDAAWNLTERVFKDLKMSVTYKEESQAGSTRKIGFKGTSNPSGWQDTYEFEFFPTKMPSITQVVVQVNLVYGSGAQ